MSLYDLGQLLHLRKEFEKASGPLGLFHVTRILFGLDGSPHEGLDQGWGEFMGEPPLSDLSVDEVNGPFFQQSGYFGAVEKLNDYTGLAAATLGQFPLGTSPVIFHHRDARTDRNQWTLGLYRFSRRLEWHIAVDFRGRGSYSQLNFDSEAISLLGCFTRDPDKLRRYHQTWRNSLEQHGDPLPRHVYAAIVTDLFKASMLAIDHQIKAIEQGQYDPRKGVLLPGQTLFRGCLDNPVIMEGQPGQESQPDAASKREDKAPGAWPPDDDWHFRPGEFAFAGRTHSLSGKNLELLKALVEARGPVTMRGLQDKVWGSDSLCDDKNIRRYLSYLRKKLREVYDLSDDVNPIPHVDTGAWRLDKECLRSVSAD